MWMLRKEKDPVYGRGSSPFKKMGVRTFPALEKDLSAQVLIIGGGITGLLCAYGLAEKGISSVLCEAHSVGGCSTAFAPPFLLPDGDVSLRNLVKKFGREEARTTFSELKSTLNYAQDIVRKTGGDCGFRIKDSFLFAESDTRTDALSEEYRLRKYSGFQCEKMSQRDCEESFSFKACGGIYTPSGGAEINVPLLAESIARYLEVRGVEIYEHCPIFELSRKGSGFSAIVSGGKAVISAEKVIDCRGLKQPIPQLKNAVVYSAVSLPQDDFYGWKNRCIVKSISSSPIIACTTEDGRLYLEGFPGKRILGRISAECGFGRLEDAAERMFFGSRGDAPSIFYERTFSRSADGLPYMGRVDENGDLYRVHASGRCGLTAALLASILIPSAMSGDKEAERRLREYEVF